MCLVDWQDVLDRFQFKQDGACNDDIGKVGLVELDVFVNQRERDFPFEFQTGVFQFPTEAMLIGGLEQTGTELAVYLDGEVDDAIGQGRGGFLRIHAGVIGRPWLLKR